MENDGDNYCYYCLNALRSPPGTARHRPAVSRSRLRRDAPLLPPPPPPPLNLEEGWKGRAHLQSCKLWNACRHRERVRKHCNIRTVPGSNIHRTKSRGVAAGSFYNELRARERLIIIISPGWYYYNGGTEKNKNKNIRTCRRCKCFTSTCFFYFFNLLARYLLANTLDYCWRFFLFLFDFGNYKHLRFRHFPKSWQEQHNITLYDIALRKVRKVDWFKKNHGTERVELLEFCFSKQVSNCLVTY